MFSTAGTVSDPHVAASCTATCGLLLQRCPQCSRETFCLACVRFSLSVATHRPVLCCLQVTFVSAPALPTEGGQAIVVRGVQIGGLGAPVSLTLVSAVRSLTTTDCTVRDMFAACAQDAVLVDVLMVGLLVSCLPLADLCR